MKNVDLTSIRDIDIHYEKIVSTLDERFKCEWDDAVHESYGRYVNQIRDLSREVKIIRSKLESLEKEVYNLKVEELIHEAENLCREANIV